MTLFLVAIFFVLLDQELKVFALAGLAGGKISLIKGLLAFNLTKNPYIAFSLPLAGFWLNLGIFLILAFILAIILKNCRRPGLNSAFLFFIFLGGLSNLIDRLRFGYVIDYLDLSYFTVFNLADAMITFGVLALFYFNFREVLAKNVKNPG